MKCTFLPHCLIAAIILIMSAIFFVKTFNMSPLYAKPAKSMEFYSSANFNSKSAAYFKDKIILKNGISVTCRILMQKEKYLVIYVPWGMTIIPKSHILEIKTINN